MRTEERFKIYGRLRVGAEYDRIWQGIAGYVRVWQGLAQRRACARFIAGYLYTHQGIFTKPKI